MSSAPTRDECVGSQCELTLLCRECLQYEDCPIVGYPKVTPENEEALHTYQAVRSGLLVPFSPEVVYARDLARLLIIDTCVKREDLAAQRAITEDLRNRHT